MDMTTVKDRITAAARRQEHEYSGDSDRPLGGYLGALSVYGSLVSGAAVLARATGRQPPERIAPWDAMLIAVAAHKLARLIAKDPVTSPLRAPFTRYEGTSGPAELTERVRGHGGREVAGELISSPFSIGTWAATAFVVGHVFVPRLTRLATTSLAAQAGADFLQFAYTAAEHAAQGGQKD